MVALDHLNQTLATLTTVVQGVLDHESAMEALIDQLRSQSQDPAIETVASAMDAQVAKLTATIPVTTPVPGGGSPAPTPGGGGPAP